MQPLVSVVMAAYNCGQYITDAINSVINQTYPNIELIIVDDGSTDNTLEAVALASKGISKPRIYYAAQENKGVAAAKNAGIQAAKGDYIAFLDADDWLLADYIEKNIAQMQADNLDAISCNFIETNENRDLIRFNAAFKERQPRFFIFEELIANPFPLGFLVIRAKYLKKFFQHNENLRFAEDFDLWLRLLRWERLKWGYNKQPLALYMLRSDSICHTYQKNAASQLWEIYKNQIGGISRLKAWLYYRKHLARYRYAMLKKALKAKQLPRIINHALIAARSPLFFPVAVYELLKLYKSRLAVSK